MKILKRTKYLAEYLVIILLFKLIRFIGIDRGSNLVITILQKFKNIIPFTKIARKNIRFIYDLSPAKQEELIDKIYDNFGRFITEVALLETMDLESIRQRVTINGMEHIRHFQEQNKPFLIFTGHFANWEMVLSILTKIYPDSAVVHRKVNNPYVNNFISAQREKFGVSLIPKGPYGGKILMKALRAKKAIVMLVDQKMNEGIEVPFMGQSTMTSDGLAKIALSFDYPIVPLQIVRVNNTSHFHVNLFSPLEIETTGDKNQDIRNIVLATNQIIEEWINEHPDQWLWFHRRWKSQ
jgi:KDO2-lipid IV(A) lauroyltransferase